MTRKVNLVRLSRSRVCDRPRVSEKVQDVEGRVGLHQASRCLHRHMWRRDNPQGKFVTQFGEKRHRFDTQTVFLNVTAATNTSPIQEIIFRNRFPIVLLECIELLGPLINFINILWATFFVHFLLAKKWKRGFTFLINLKPRVSKLLF